MESIFLIVATFLSVLPVNFSYTTLAFPTVPTIEIKTFPTLTEDRRFLGSIQFWKIYHLWENVKGKNSVRSLTMNQEKQERIKACLQELSTLLYEESDKSKLTDLEGIEKTVRSQVLELVSPEIALFLSNKKLEQK